jgi:hypothetical protein
MDRGVAVCEQHPRDKIDWWLCVRGEVYRQSAAHGRGLDWPLADTRAFCTTLRVYVITEVDNDKRDEELKVTVKVKVTVKQPHYRPGQAVRVPGRWDSQICKQSAREGGKVVRPKHRPPLPPRKYSWYSFLLETESTPEPQCDRKVYVNEKFQWHQRESNPRRSGL